MPAARPLPQTLGELRTSTQFPEACLKNTNRQGRDARQPDCAPQVGRNAFSRIIGYEDTVMSANCECRFVEAEFYSAGVARTGKSRILRALTALLDEQTPYMAGCEIRDNP